ncbi:MAG: hypothetical protein IKX62_04470 [Bacteroidales bacterium]|nr:hypothetical protein [Bacteroidales bacterium]
MDLYEMLLPLAICVILPVMIVWFVSRVRQNETNRKAEIMLKAIENGASIDPALFKTESKKKASIKQDMLDKLTGGCITSLMGVAFLTAGLLFAYHPLWHAFLSPSLLIVAGAVMMAVGIGLFITFITGRKMLAKEMEAEERDLLENK